LKALAATISLTKRKPKEYAIATVWSAALLWRFGKATCAHSFSQSVN
jgi:hypothetical protein